MSGCAATTDPTIRAYLHEQKAYKAIKMRDLQKAEKELEKAIRDDPKNPTILNNLAFIEFKEKEFDKAIGFLEQARAVKTNDDDDPYVMNEARILVLQHKYGKALRLLKMVEPRPRWPKGYKKLYAKILVKEGHVRKALKILLQGKDEWNQ